MKARLLICEKYKSIILVKNIEVFADKSYTVQA